MNQYAPTIDNPATVARNRNALVELGCTPAQADAFADRKYAALPAWLRKRIKAASKTRQEEPRKLKPAAGELAFYVSPYRFRRADPKK